uniref:Lysosomal acid phosphatase n=1 Tax=Steinernema glaseri TaxID=37863 RepID=A0A1I8ARP7_9BILA
MLTGLFPVEHERSHVIVKANKPHWEDQLLKPNSVKCDKYDVVALNENRKLFTKFNAKYSAFFSYVSQHTGWNVSMENVGDVFNAVYRETVHGLTQPAWLTREFHANRSAYDLVLELKRVQRLVEFNSPLKAKLRAGYLLGNFVRKLEKAARGEHKYKLVLYSSHDATLTALLYNMMINNDLLTPYAAAVIVELHEDDDGDHFVRVFYRNDTSVPPYQLQVPGCLYADCPLELFISVLEPRIYRSKQAHLNACEVVRPFEDRRPTVESHEHRSHFFLLVTSTILSLIVMLQGVCLFKFLGHTKLVQRI